MDRAPDNLLANWHGRVLALEAAVGAAIVGQSRAIRLITVATFARGHALLQGDVGVGKTTLLRAFAHVQGGGFGRIEGAVSMAGGERAGWSGGAVPARRPRPIQVGRSAAATTRPQR